MDIIRSAVRAVMVLNVMDINVMSIYVLYIIVMDIISVLYCIVQLELKMLVY